VIKTSKDTSKSEGSAHPPIQNPKDKSKPFKKSNQRLGGGISSAVSGVEPDLRPLQCEIPGFPGEASRYLDGTVRFECMDDTGGTWNFWGAKDEVLVSWSIFDSITGEYEKGDQVFEKCTHFNQVIRTLGTKYHYAFNCLERDERLDFSKGGDLAMLGTSRTKGAPAPGELNFESPRDSRRDSSPRRSHSSAPTAWAQRAPVGVPTRAPVRYHQDTDSRSQDRDARSAGRSASMSRAPRAPVGDSHTTRAPVSEHQVSERRSQDRDARRVSRTRGTRDREEVRRDPHWSALRATTGGTMRATQVTEGHLRDMSLNGAGMSLRSHTVVRHLTGMRRNLWETLDTKGTTIIHTGVNLSLVRHRDHNKFPHETHP
jgi:hypothetical protein